MDVQVRVAQLEQGLAELVQRLNNVDASLGALRGEKARLEQMIARQEGGLAALREVLAAGVPTVISD